MKKFLSRKIAAGLMSSVMLCSAPVSYTHLDVYKRQEPVIFTAVQTTILNHLKFFSDLFRILILHRKLLTKSRG